MKRSNQKIITTHSKILRHMRVEKGLSMRQAASEIGLSDSMVNHVENGRVDISEKIISKFLSAYGRSRKDYDLFLSGKMDIPIDYREACSSIIKNMDEPKLKAIYGLLSNF